MTTVCTLALKYTIKANGFMKVTFVDCVALLYHHSHSNQLTISQNIELLSRLLAKIGHELKINLRQQYILKILQYLVEVLTEEKLVSRLKSMSLDVGRVKEIG